MAASCSTLDRGSQLKRLSIDTVIGLLSQWDGLFVVCITAVIARVSYPWHWVVAARVKGAELVELGWCLHLEVLHFTLQNILYVRGAAIQIWTVDNCVSMICHSSLQSSFVAKVCTALEISGIVAHLTGEATLFWSPVVSWLGHQLMTLCYVLGLVQDIICSLVQSRAQKVCSLKIFAIWKIVERRLLRVQVIRHVGIYRIIQPIAFHGPNFWSNTSWSHRVLIYEIEVSANFLYCPLIHIIVSCGETLGLRRHELIRIIDIYKRASLQCVIMVGRRHVF